MIIDRGRISGAPPVAKSRKRCELSPRSAPSPTCRPGRRVSTAYASAATANTEWDAGRRGIDMQRSNRVERAAGIWSRSIKVAPQITAWMNSRRLSTCGSAGSPTASAVPTWQRPSNSARRGVAAADSAHRRCHTTVSPAASNAPLTENGAIKPRSGSSKRVTGAGPRPSTSFKVIMYPGPRVSAGRRE